MRSGVIAQKVGMTRVFTDAGEHVPVTVLKVDSCQVVAHRTKDKNGYTALQLGVGRAKVKNVSAAERGRFAVAKVEPKRKLAEFRVTEDAVIPVGAEITADHFIPGQFVDVTGTTTGKGFAGGMKRWNFGGLRASHGVSVSHRSIGSTGGRQDPGKTFKNKKMPGHLGVERVTTQNLRVVQTDVERGLILVEGAVPGVAGGWISVRDAVKRKLPAEVPMPGKFRGPAGEAAPAAAAGSGGRGRGECVMKIDITTFDGGSAGSVELDEAIFGLEPRAGPPAALRPLAARQAPGRHARGEEPVGDRSHDEEDLQAEGHRQRPARRRERPAVPRRRPRLRPAGAQPRARPAEEGAGARAEARAVGEGQGRVAHRRRRRAACRAEDQGAEGDASASSGSRTRSSSPAPRSTRTSAARHATSRTSMSCRCRASTSTTSCAATSSS